jgi:hypothetical protein
MPKTRISIVALDYGGAKDQTVEVEHVTGARVEIIGSDLGSHMLWAAVIEPEREVQTHRGRSQGDSYP